MIWLSVWPLPHSDVSAASTAARSRRSALHQEEFRAAWAEGRACFLMAGVHAMQSAASVVELMYRAAGTSGIYADSPLGRHFRDIEVVRQHVLYAESRYETVGQIRLGLSPDLRLVDY